MELDKLYMANKPFANFLAQFTRLADRCQQQPIKRVELLKGKVTFELLDCTMAKGTRPERNDFNGWCTLFQTTIEDILEVQDFKSQNPTKTSANNHSQNYQNQKPQHTTTPAPHSDAMDLIAISSKPPGSAPNILRPPLGIDIREFCRSNNLCFYCKSTDHKLTECREKRDADQRRPELAPSALPSPAAHTWQLQLQLQPQLQP
jgi:hypothetical protein